MFTAKLFAAALAGLSVLVAGRTIPPEFQELENRQNSQYQGYGFVYFTGEDLPNGAHTSPIQHIIVLNWPFFLQENKFTSPSAKETILCTGT
ncbi:hypothetical protein OPQ81_011543 [Rhizoctonia solani]|nr:hypothetical protein OPQ81_011543 [Rhizoctonia solani]